MWVIIRRERDYMFSTCVQQEYARPLMDHILFSFWYKCEKNRTTNTHGLPSTRTHHRHRSTSHDRHQNLIRNMYCFLAERIALRETKPQILFDYSPTLHAYAPIFWCTMSSISVSSVVCWRSSQMKFENSRVGKSRWNAYPSEAVVYLLHFWLFIYYFLDSSLILKPEHEI